MAARAYLPARSPSARGDQGTRPIPNAADVRVLDLPVHEGVEVLEGAPVRVGAGLGNTLESEVAADRAAGRRVSEDWCPPFPGRHLYYPDRQVTPALRALIDVLRWRGVIPA